MPIVTVELVCESEAEAGAVSARALADALGQVFRSPPGRTWVRLRILGSGAYAENGASLGAFELPAFVTVLQARPQSGSALAAEVLAVTEVVAKCIGRPVERVHVEYAPQAAGRQAFGGHLVE
jgi:phenylpyruvate tautomerase PptA (4-oxalocrotonate tautomerase family)